MAITPRALLEQMDAGKAPRILDVRSEVEFERGRVPGALHIPFQKVGQRAAEIPGSPTDELLVYCAFGPRAWIAGRRLRRLGFTHITYLKGHMAAWRRDRLPEER
jgi:rhodanese-related sulfurtransferase